MRPNLRAFVFDLGGTLLDYEGLTYSWADWYEEAFGQVRAALALKLDQSQITAAIATLRKYNARLNPREIEYSAEHIFTEATQTWELGPASVNDVSCCFYRTLQKRVRVFADTAAVLTLLHKKGYPLGILTDVPTGMPEELVREDVALLGCRIDRVLTSVEVGYRKPHRRGLEKLADEFGVALEQMAFVGDEEKDIQAAKNVGAMAVYINRKRDTSGYGEDIQINELSSLTAW